MIYKLTRFFIIIAVLVTFMYVADELDHSGSIIYPELTYSLLTEEDLPKSADSIKWTTSMLVQPVFWIRSFVDLSNSQLHNDLQLTADLSGSYIVYWNGTPIGENGRFSVDPENEVPGFAYSKYIIPKSLANKKKNELLIKISHHKKRGTKLNPKITIGNFNEASKNEILQSVVIHFLAGIFFIVAMYYAFLYFISYRRPAFILFSLLCLAGFMLIIIGFSKVYYPIRYDLYDIRFWFFRLVSFSVALGTPIFLFYHFNLPHKSKFIVALCLLSITAWVLPNNYSWIALIVGFGAQFATTIWALFNYKTGSIEVLVGQLTFVIGFVYFNIAIYLGFSILVIAILFSLSLSFREERRKQEITELKSVRLQAELLKKNIQPHFLMNTLTTIMSLIETNPKDSVALINNLSEEFSTLSDIVDKRLITLEQELDLCRSYLKVMSIRNDIDYLIHEVNLGNDMTIPPAIIHTLIENGVTHNSPINNKMTFDVSCYQKDHFQIIEVISHGLTSEINSENGEGMGLKYIKSRLDESHFGNWTIHTDRHSDFWKTYIKIEC